MVLHRRHVAGRGLGEELGVHLQEVRGAVPVDDGLHGRVAALAVELGGLPARHAEHRGEVPAGRASPRGEEGGVQVQLGCVRAQVGRGLLHVLDRGGEDRLAREPVFDGWRPHSPV